MKRLLTTLVCMLLTLGTTSAQEITTAKKRKAEAQVNKALDLIENGESEKGFKLLRKVAKRGDAGAQFNLGICYNVGVGVEKNPDVALKWWRMAADQGLAEAQTNLGTCYQRGIVVEQNYEEAIRLYQLAAEQEHARAYYNLAGCYYFGIGVEEDFEDRKSVV